MDDKDRRSSKENQSNLSPSNNKKKDKQANKVQKGAEKTKNDQRNSDPTTADKTMTNDSCADFSNHHGLKVIERRGKEKDPGNSNVSIDKESQLNDEEITVESPYAYLEQDENPIKGHWTGKFDYILSTLGYAVGLGNVWKFPYQCYKYGGGAFLVPYLLSLVVLGIPMFFIDVTIGQFCSNGPFTCWEYAPIFTGIGYAMVTISTMVAIYYNVIIGYSIYYIIASVMVPWQYCNNTWNTPNCIYNFPNVNCSLSNQLSNGTCVNSNNTFVGVWNQSLFTSTTNRTLVLAADEYFNREVLAITGDITQSGGLQWKVCLSLLAAWLSIFGCLYGGIKSSGKAVYFTAVFPYVCLFILLLRGVLLDGAVDGMKLFIVPDLTQLQNPSVWKEAASQIFFSLTTNWGGLITLSSYNRFHDNILRDTIFVTLVNCFTSIFAGFMIFCYLGHLAKVLSISVASVASQGLGLAFIIFPEAVARLPGSYVWSALFFIMVLTMGLSSQAATVETSITSFIDCFPEILRPRRKWLLAFACIFLFLLGLPMCSRSGVFWLTLMDAYCGGWAILLIAICEVVSIGWIYGRPGFKWSNPMRFLRDIEVMLKRPVSVWWRLCYQYLTPLTLLFVLIVSWKDYSKASYNNQSYPLWADLLGWAMTLISLIFIPGAIVFRVIRERQANPDHNLSTIFYNLTLPTYKWGPHLPKFRMLVAEQLEDCDDYYIDVARRIKYKDVKSIDFGATVTKF